MPGHCNPLNCNQKSTLFFLFSTLYFGFQPKSGRLDLKQRPRRPEGIRAFCGFDVKRLVVTGYRVSQKMGIGRNSPICDKSIILSV